MRHSAWPEQSVKFAFFFFAYYGFVGVFSPYASLYFSDKGMTAAQVGVLMSLMQVMRIFGPNLWGWIADHTARRVGVLRATAAAACVAFIGIFMERSFAGFFAVMVALNLFLSAQVPLSEALMLSEMRGDLTHYGRLRLWGSVGFIASVAVAGPLLDWSGIGWMPPIALLLLSMALAASLAMRERPQFHHHAGSPSTMALLRRREVVAFFASSFLMVAAHAALYVYYSLYLAGLGYSKSVIGLMWSAGVIAEIVFFFYQAPVFRRIGVRRLMLATFAIAVLRFVMIGMCAESFVLLFIAQLMHAATFGAHHSSSVLTLQRWFSGPLQARGQALYTSISYGLGGSLGGLLLASVWETFGAHVVYWTAAALAFAGLIAAALSYRWQEDLRETK